MKKLVRLMGVIFLAGSLFLTCHLARDKQFLRNQMIRLHVVGASNSAADQEIKIQVKNAILCCLEEIMPDASNCNTIKAFLAKNLETLETVANDVLQSAGSEEKARVTLKQEPFPARNYDTFMLPSGVYESLRICIGAGEGKNWWCVIFPSLCEASTAEEYEDIAVSAGAPDGLIQATTQQPGYEIRFFLLDCLGKLENFFQFK